MAPPPKRKSDSVLPETKRYQLEREYLESLMAKHAQAINSANEESVSMKSNETDKGDPSKTEQTHMSAQQPEQHGQHEQHEHDAVKKAEFAVRPAKRLTNTTRLSKTISKVRQLEAANVELKEQVMDIKQKQDGAVKKTVEKAFTDEVTKAIEKAITVQLGEAVKNAVAKQLSMEVKKEVAAQLLEQAEKIQN